LREEWNWVWEEEERAGARREPVGCEEGGGGNG